MKALEILIVAIVSGAVQPASEARPPAVAEHPGKVNVQAATPEGQAEWDKRLAGLVRSGGLKVRDQRESTDGKVRDQWLIQLHRGVPVAGGEVWRRMEGGALADAEGVIFEKIGINPVPKLTRAEAREALLAMLPPGSAGPSREPELVVLPTPDGKYVLTYRSAVFDGTTLETYYLDATTGVVVLTESAPPMPARP